jgi:hypothetical protein
MIFSVCIVTIIRTVKSTEFSFNDNFSCGMWSIVEIHVAIISACLPVLKPLFFTPKSASSTPAISRRSLYPTNSSNSRGLNRNNRTRETPKDSYSMTDGSLWQDDEDAGTPQHTRDDGGMSFQMFTATQFEKVNSWDYPERLL